MTISSPLDPVFYTQEDSIPLAFQYQFLVTPTQDYDVVLEGTMHRIWHYSKWFKPLFSLLGRVGILVPKTGENIPAKLVVKPGVYPNGQPFHEWNRVFEFDPPIKFETTVVFDETYQNIADRVGTNHFLHMVWDGKFVSPNQFTLDTIANGFRFRDKIWFIPKWLWSFLLGRVKFVQTAHEDNEEVVDVDLRIIHPLFGEVFGYIGTFHAKKYPK